MNSSHIESLVISKKNIVDAVAQFLYQVKAIPSEANVSDIDFSKLFSGNERTVEINVHYDLEKEVDVKTYG